MDQTDMQQTVMDPPEDTTAPCGAIQPPLDGTGNTTTNSTPISPDNTCLEAAVDSLTISGGEAAPASTTLAPAPTYDELFPALPSVGSDSASLAPSVSVASVSTSAPGGWGTAARNNDNMRIQSSVITQVFHVLQEERAKLDGSTKFGESASLSICTDISKETGAHIEISSAKDQSLTFLVTGKNEAVAKARKMVLEKFQAQNRFPIKIPKEHHKFLLGKKGKKLQDLEQCTGTKIQVPSAADPSEVVTVVGLKEGVEKALHEIRIISDEQSKKAYEVVDIPCLYHPFLNGGNKSLVNSLTAEHSVNINMPPPSLEKSEIRITGEKESVLKVKDILLKTYKDLEKKCQTVSVEVPKAQHKHVRGTRGCNIAEILDNFNVSVEVPNSNSNSGTVTLRGPQENLGHALTMVYAKANSVMQADLNAPTWLHRYIIGRKGANINKITQEYPQVRVEFTAESEVITLDGPREDVESAREKMESMISEMRSRLTQDEMSVDAKFHKHIIGKAGSNINRIRNETNVLINIKQDGSNIIKMEGQPEAVQQVKKELEELVKKMENEKEREIVIESRLHRNIIGTRGENIRVIREQYNQVQISFPDANQKSNVVKIRGPKPDVDACYKHLQKLVQELLENNYQIRVPIFKQFLKFIIGKSGANINKIRKETDTRISMSTSDEGSDEIFITGRKENCEKARERIHQIQEELANIVDVDILVPAKFHNSIIGQRGRLIRSISEECGGVSIKFPPPDKKSDKVTIRGPKEDVMKAKKILVDLSNERQLASCTAEVRCKLQHHKFLIGKNGSNIRKVRDETGARIMFPAEKDDDRELITIIGKKDQVALAKASLESTIKELDNIVENSVNVPRKHHLHFIQRRGEVLKQLQDQYGGVTISFPRNGSNSEVVNIKGPIECVAGVKDRITEIVKELESKVSIEVVIPQRHHRTVMGPRGTCVQGIIAEHHVEIKFPERASGSDAAANRRDDEPVAENGEVPDCDKVVVRGTPENCEGAKVALLAMVPVTEQVTVPFKFHRFIIGQGGKSVRNLMNTHDVNIQVPPAADQTDVIKVVGFSSNVEKARLALLEQVQKLEEEELDKQKRSFSLSINVDPEYHPKIIGRRGAVVSKIREKYGVNIQFPQRTDPDPSLITITGYEENCNEAKQAIVDITGDLSSMIKMPVEIDNRVHARLIGQRGKAIRKVMEEYKVSISFPRDDGSPNTVTIMGAENRVLDCKDHLLNLEEEFLQEIRDREDMNDYNRRPCPQLSLSDSMPVFNGAASESWGGSAEAGESFAPEPAASSSEAAPLAASSSSGKAAINGGVNSAPHGMTNGGSSTGGGRGGEGGGVGPNGNRQGFVVTGAPWAQEAPNMNSSKDFPSMGAATSAPLLSSAWNRKR